MNKRNNRNTLAILSFALASALAAPAAFAQSVPANPQDPAAQAMPQQQPTETAPQAAPAQKTWAELDANGNGSLSASEAAPIESLTKVFATADTNGDGELTADEYKAWLAANGSKSQSGQG